MMRFSLRFKLTAAFLSITLIFIILIGTCVNLILERQFKSYILDQQAKKDAEIVQTLETRYADWGNKWDSAGLETLGVGALGESLMLRISDGQENVLWDAMTHNKGMCATILQNMAANMRGRNVGVKGGYAEKSYPILVNSQVVGHVVIGYYGPYFYSDSDIRFLDGLNRLLLLAAGGATLISFVFGAYMAKRLTSPISRVIKAAGQISKGNFDDRIHEDSNTKEIVELTDAINTLAQTLGKQEALRKRMTADVAHELRTPVANLQSHLEAMIDGIWKPEPERLKSCHEETVRISKMVSDLEKLARFEGENLVLVKSRFDLSKLLDKITGSFANDFRNKRIRLEMDNHEIFLTADEDKVEQIIINILSNALKYTPDGGTVCIRTERQDKNIEISIRDNGLGISLEDLPYIFDRFYRADTSRSRATGGSGIGLAIAKSLADAHGGSIRVVSELDKGSEFIVTLPA